MKLPQSERERLQLFLYFIRERWRVYQRKERGDPKPWTQDILLQTYKFTNVHRENDRVTRWIVRNWIHPHCTDPDLWFAVTVARFLNWPATLQHISYPVPWRSTVVREKLRDRERAGLQIFTGAYLIKSHKGSKIDYIVQRFEDYWAHRKRLRPARGESLRVYAAHLRAMYGFGSFMTGQIIADLKQEEPLVRAADWWTWAASGPGSRRGLLYLREGGLIQRSASWAEEDWHTALLQLKKHVDKYLQQQDIPPLCAQNLQNCLCEFSKYVRALQGIGRPRSLYPGVGGILLQEEP